MLTKEQVFSAVGEMPEQFSIDQLIDRLLFIDKVEVGLKQSEAGLVKTKDEVKRRLAKWLK